MEIGRAGGACASTRDATVAKLATVAIGAAGTIAALIVSAVVDKRSGRDGSTWFTMTEAPTTVTNATTIFTAAAADIPVPTALATGRALAALLVAAALTVAAAHAPSLHAIAARTRRRLASVGLAAQRAFANIASRSESIIASSVRGEQGSAHGLRRTPVGQLASVQIPC
jgi:hypothetical protein